PSQCYNSSTPMPNSDFSLFNQLLCSHCRKEFDPTQVQTFCQDCNSPLVCNYRLENNPAIPPRTEFLARPRNMWRWHEFLPVRSLASIVTLGEGDTPTLTVPRLSAAISMDSVFLKDEGQNPTGSFKARGLSAAISKAKELGIDKVIIPTAGNAGGAMAAYASRAGMRACVFMPADTPLANIEECRITGAQVELVDGLISDAARLAAQKAQSEGWFDVSTFKEPYRLEGKKVMGFEIAEAFGWKLPDVIVYPTGGGTGLVGIWKAFQELEALGWLDSPRRPRMVAVQAAGCAPVVKAFASGAEICEFWPSAQTSASGLRVPKPFADRLILEALRASQGTAVAVTEEEIQSAQSLLARTEGVFAAPEGAATLAGLIRLRNDAWLEPGALVLLLNTGTGLKYIL
ncbi:MAG TPA: threonine synthase, partial [Anaerolineaceae bacterium]|nr:threonine synthase [Anaerolineaceae bacterium]